MTDASDDELLFDRLLETVALRDSGGTDRVHDDAGALSPELAAHLLRASRLLQPPDADARPAFERIGPYRLLGEIGRGGMGSVHLAVHELLQRRVALKLLGAALADSPTATTRFQREARALGRLSHPGVVQVYDAGVADGHAFLAMEPIDGPSLEERIAAAADGREPLPPRTAVRWAAELARALAHVHAHGIVHRDVKPSNIRLAGGERPVLVDFGLALDQQGSAPTITGSIVGTPHYLAPEQIGAGRGAIDGRTDVYGLGVTLYHALTLRAPFAGHSVEQVLSAVLIEDPPPPRQLVPGLSRELELVVLAAIEKDPARRHPTAAAFAEDLEAVLEFRPVRARGPGLVRRVRRWSRRRPRVAGLVAALAIACAAGLAVFASVSAARANERRGEAARVFDAARRGVALYAADRERTRELERTVAALEEQDRYLNPSEERLRFQDGQELAELRFRRELEFNHVLDQLRRAEEVGVPSEEVRDVRAELYLVRWKAACVDGDDTERRVYESLVRENDASGALADQLVLRERLVTRARGEPELHLFRLRYLDELVPRAERRLVAVPKEGFPPGVDPEAFALRVVVDAGGFEREDLVLSLAGWPIEGLVLVEDGAGRYGRLRSIDEHAVRSLWDADRWGAIADWRDPPPHPARSFSVEWQADREVEVLRARSLAELGLVPLGPVELARRAGVRARVHRAGQLEDVELPGGLETRVTARPLYVGASSHFIAAAPAELSLVLELGGHLVLARAPGCEAQRIPYRVAADGRHCSPPIELQAAGTTPAGWVWVGPREYGADGFCALEREVTVGEYFEFLNDPETLAALARATSPVLFPRNGANASLGGHCARDAVGRFVVPDNWPLARPIGSISLDDAEAYCAWLTASDPGDRGWVYSLPGPEEWTSMTQPNSARWVYGDQFHASWQSSVFAHPSVGAEPVLGHPRDESPIGLFDVAGSMSEWILEPVVDGTLYRTRGGSWGHGDPELFQVFSGAAMGRALAVDSAGFRLIARRAKERSGR